MYLARQLAGILTIFTSYIMIAESPVAARSEFPVPDCKHSLYRHRVKTNNYETDVTFPENCNPGPCSPERLREYYSNLQEQNQYKNLLIPHRTTPDSIRLAIYNVHFWQYPDKPQYDRQHNAADDIIDDLVRMDADVVMLQEVLFDPQVIDLLLKSLEVKGKRYFYCQEAHNYQQGFPVGNMTIFLNDFDIHSVTNHIYNPSLLQFERRENERSKSQLYTPDQKLRKKWRAEIPGRCSIISTVAQPGRKQHKIQMTNVHLDHRGNSYHRMIHLVEVFRMMDKDSLLPGARLVAGDFNTIHGDHLTTGFARQIMADARKRNQTLALNELRLMSIHGFGDSFDSACIRPPAVSVWSLTRIDYLFVERESTLCLKGQYVYYTTASDHAALLFDFEFIP